MLWRLLAAACLLYLVNERLDRPRPPRPPVTIVMSQAVFVRDSAIGSAYVEFRSTNRREDGSTPRCAETPQFTVERRAASLWLPMQTVRRDCGPAPFDGNPGGSVTWHTRLRVPGRYRIRLVYVRRWKAVLATGPEFNVR